jgi:hypothetical protein
MAVVTVFQQLLSLKIIKNENVKSTFYTFQIAEMWIGGFGTTLFSFHNQSDVDTYSSIETMVWIVRPPFIIISHANSNSTMLHGC